MEAGKSCAIWNGLWHWGQESHPVVQPSQTEVIGRLTLDMVVSPSNQTSLPPKVLATPPHSFYLHGSLCQPDLATHIFTERSSILHFLTPETVRIFLCSTCTLIGPGISQWLGLTTLVFFIQCPSYSWTLFWPHGKRNWSFWIKWRHKRKCFIQCECSCTHMCMSVYFCQRERDRGLFRRSSPRSSYWVQTVRLLHRLGPGPPGSQRKVPFLVPLKLNCGHRPRNLETQLLIYQHTNYIRYSLSHCRPFEQLHCEVGKPLAC